MIRAWFLLILASSARADQPEYAPPPQAVRVRGIVRIQIVEAGKPLDGEALRRDADRTLAGARACYERELQRNPNLQGRITMAVLVDATHAVTNTTVEEDTVGSADLQKCVVVRFKSVRFPSATAAKFRLALLMTRSD